MSISMALAEVNKHMNKESSNTKKQLIADEQFPVYLTPPVGAVSEGEVLHLLVSSPEAWRELHDAKGLREEYFETVRVRGTQSQVARDWENSLIKSSTPGPSFRNRQPGMLQGICVLDPRTVQDHQEHFEDPRCLQRISQAVKQLVDLGGLSIEFNLHGIRQLDFSALTPLLEQGFAPTNLRDVRLIDRGGSIRPQVSDHVCFKLQIKQNLQYSDASRFLEVYVVAARALDPALLGTIERTLKMPAAFDESHKRSENS
ncbi:uncharacterized protein FOBCDRAFT_275904 [Fusarium oxysporum Fo47]|uniref:uncharacterized protein n=1 Tax=Fusarium oxysporum Fo47 TaxID=660027 RepID=UPI0015999BD2|nr:uncharacterized protein FOBCDRAFT_275904 [Fusarium oxysporum Fo47]QKD56330.1 hypothetical protein FOBCDRAFT_275904 [Fusarium oxysporum Fo47]